ncbi:MAG: nucleotidyltransferase domain-containing protein [Candidatus Margulisbacteria bacterium]|nr:nucleotidyltransferase domain-containing protein [Candidatus Margulisiibacteriota bacterium]
MNEETKKVIEGFLGKVGSIKPRLGSIYLFGSRARGTARPDSDYDILLIVPEKNREIRDRLYDAAVDVQIDTGADLSLKIVKQADFERMRKLAYPFIENILNEGIKVG